MYRKTFFAKYEAHITIFSDFLRFFMNYIIETYSGHTWLLFSQETTPYLFSGAYKVAFVKQKNPYQIGLRKLTRS